MSTSPTLRFLVLDAYPESGRAAVRNAGGTLAGELYSRLLRRLAADCVTDIAFPADADFALPAGVGLGDYDGAVWTGSSLTIYDESDRRVTRQIELARAIAAAEVPSFGSCWAAQLSVVASGGRCAANPRGREFGVARRIELTAEAAQHPMYRGKARVFDAFTSHADHIVDLGPRAQRLATNAFSPVQAVAVEGGRASFWAVQYHPEYDLHEVASLCRLRTDELIRQGTFSNRDEATLYIDRLEALHAEPERQDLREILGVDAALLDETERSREVANWIRFAVLEPRPTTTRSIP